MGSGIAPLPSDRTFTMRKAEATVRGTMTAFGCEVEIRLGRDLGRFPGLHHAVKAQRKLARAALPHGQRRQRLQPRPEHARLRPKIADPERDARLATDWILGQYGHPMCW